MENILLRKRNSKLPAKRPDVPPAGSDPEERVRTSGKASTLNADELRICEQNCNTLNWSSIAFGIKILIKFLCQKEK